MTNYGIYRLMILVDVQGGVLAVNSIDPAGKAIDTSTVYAMNFANASWFTRAIAGDFLQGKNGLTGTVVEQPAKSPVVAAIYKDDGFTIPFAAPVKNAAGEVVGGRGVEQRRRRERHPPHQRHRPRDRHAAAGWRRHHNRCGDWAWRRRRAAPSWPSARPGECRVQRLAFVDVVRRPRVAVLATGDEIVPPDVTASRWAPAVLSAGDCRTRLRLAPLEAAPAMVSKDRSLSAPVAARKPSNRVTTSKAAAPWRFGVRDLMRNLAGRGEVEVVLLAQLGPGAGDRLADPADAQDQQGALLRVPLRQSVAFQGQAGQEGPLVVVGLQVTVDEDPAAAFTGRFLQWQGDQIAEPTLGHRVLVREQPVVGREPELPRARAGVADDGRAQAAGITC